MPDSCCIDRPLPACECVKAFHVLNARGCEGVLYSGDENEGAVCTGRGGVCGCAVANALPNVVRKSGAVSLRRPVCAAGLGVVAR